MFLIIAIVLLLLLAGGGAYAYYSGAFISLSRLTAEAMDSARSAHSAAYDTTATIDLSEITDAAGGLSQLVPGVAGGKLSLTTTGLYDVSDPENTKGSSFISINLGSLSLAAEIRVLNDTLYAELTNAPVIAFFPMLSSYQNKWISFPYKGQNGQVTGNPLSSSLGIDTGIMSKLSPDQKDHVYQMLRNASLLKTVKRFSPEEIGGALSYHFSFDLDQAGIAAYLQSLKSYINDIGKNDSVLSSFDPTSLAKELAKIKDFKGEIWIGRQDHLPHKLTLTFGVNPDETKPGQIKVNVVSILSDWNKPVAVVAPADSVPFETFVSNMMPSPVKAPQTNAKKPPIKSKK